MKILLAFILSSFCILNAYAQTDNFNIENGQVVWQKVFNTDQSKEELINKIQRTGIFQNLSDNGDILTAEIQQLSLDFIGFGETEFSTPIYIARNYVNAFTLIELREERYRVTIKNIMLTQKYEDALSKEGEVTALEVYALRKRNTEFKPGFLKLPSKIINYTFQNIADFTLELEEDDW
ncbi:hypothetical protein NMK71_07385 [Weeksellaceae bacterium KMM 9713]|uniref:DUF4468 domain-containing protein n=1 Tax=Profundicola chukchiensis TaxID=2961959 RepID=A0A9X4RV12_9FLAO|nr:hypothetical protein [Profundicola chukchiensis]MDG4946231.1 hypothetical protein [Profundicola chukchiensis]